MGFQSFRMMDGGGSGDDGLIEDHDALEDDSINFWATLGVSPHVNVVDTVHPVAAPPATHHEHLQQQPQPPPPQPQHQHPHQHQHQHQQLEFVEQPVRRELFAMEADPRLEPFLAMEFESGEAAKTFYIAYAGRVGFSVRIARSRRSKCNESVIMLRFVCSREGFCREKRVVEGKKTRKRAASVREGCRAMLEVIRRGDGKWVVTKLVKEHNHQVGLPSKVHYIATEGDSELEPYMGMEFESLEIAKTFYYSYASRVGFEARVRQSRRSLHDESLKMLKLVCSKHRYHSGRDNNAEDAKMGLLLDPAREGCEALFEIIRKDNGRWMVSKLVLTHSHDLTPSPPSKVHCVRSQGEILVIAKNFDDTRNLLLNGQDSRYPREIQYNDLGPEDAENLLEYFKKTQEENPAFFYSVQVEANNCMTNIFWADAKARMAYTYFGDAVIFDTTYKSDKELIPIVTFTGLNHHAQSVVFGCALLVDESEASYLWLFEKWLEAMSSRHPVSFVTDLDRAMATAITKVFPNTRHRFSKKHILATIQEELPEFYSTQNPFDDDLRRCIEESETTEFFESCWDAILERYDLRENGYMQFLYNIRHQWVPIYLKDGFFAEIFMSQKSENFDKVVQKYFTTKTPLRVAVRQLGQAVATRYEKEAQEDFVTMSNKPFLRTASPVERQAASIYTRIIFNRFQEEFLESLGYHVDKIEDGVISKFRVVRNGDAYTVTYNASEMRAHCSCCMFEFSGILCRHALKVFIVVGMRKLPKDYILKRWTRNAKSGALLDDCGVGFQSNCEEPSTARYSDLCRDATRCAKEGATSVEAYKVAKDALQKAISEVVSVKQQKEQETLQSYIKSQKKQSRRPGKASPRDASRKNMKKMAPKESSLEIDA